jgi:hypothetical protein
MDRYPPGNQVIALTNPGEELAWSREEVLEFSADVALTEVRSEIRGGNQPSLMQLDQTSVKLNEYQVKEIQGGRFKLDLTNVKRSTTWWFADLSILYDAAVWAMDEVRRMMRVKTGAGVRSIYFQVSAPNKPWQEFHQNDHAGLKRWVDKQSDPLAGIRIMGPDVAYRTMLTYSPKGRQALRIIRTGRASGARVRYTRDQIGARAEASGQIVSLRLATAIHAVVAKRVVRRFPGTRASYQYVPSPKPLTVGKHIPRLFIGLKKPSQR